MEISSESHDPLTKLTKAENLLVLRCRAIRIEINKSEPTMPANWFAFHVLAERRFENLLRFDRNVFKDSSRLSKIRSSRYEHENLSQDRSGKSRPIIVQILQRKKERGKLQRMVSDRAFQLRHVATYGNRD